MSTKKELEAEATMALVEMAREDVKKGRVMSSSDFKEKLAARKRKLRTNQNNLNN